MSDLIGWYLTELRIQFGNRIDPATIEEILSESRSHLEEATRAIQDRGVAFETATRQALLNFGDPSAVASTYLSLKRRRRWPVSATTVMMISCFFGSFFLLIMPFIIKYDEPELIKLGIFFLVPTVLAGNILRSVPIIKISLVASTLGICTILFASVCTFTLQAPYETDRPFRSRFAIVANSLQETLKQIDAYPKWSSKGRRIYTKSKGPSDIPAEYKIKNSPYGPTFYKTPDVSRSESESLTGMTYTYEEAAQAWSEPGNSDLIGLRRRLVAEDQQLRAEAERSVNFDPELIGQTIVVVATTIFCQCFAAWVGTNIGRIRRRWHQVVYAR